MNAVEMLESIGTGMLSSLYIMGDDPVGSNPELASRLKGLEFLIVQDIFLTETAKLADVVLPAASFAEKTGTMTNLERRLQQISQAEQPLHDARADWEILQMLSLAMGAPMNYSSTADIMREIRTLVPLYRELTVGSCWKKEQSPLYNQGIELSCSSDAALTREKITSGRLLFSSGAMITRSQEIATMLPATKQ
jgi:predicted molibdopterin-dependent oxidoreductase YjgC